MDDQRLINNLLEQLHSDVKEVRESQIRMEEQVKLLPPRIQNLEISVSSHGAYIGSQKRFWAKVSKGFKALGAALVTAGTALLVAIFKGHGNS